jgi:hypothetical protein
MDESSPASAGHGASAELEPWEIALAERVVRGFLATRQPFGALAFEDLIQECLTHWWLQRPRYSAERGASRATFMRRVLKALEVGELEERVRALESVLHPRLDERAAQEKDRRGWRWRR